MCLLHEQEYGEDHTAVLSVPGQSAAKYRDKWMAQVMQEIMLPQLTSDSSGRSAHGKTRNCLTPFPVSVECLASTVGTCSSSGHLLGTSLSVRVLPMETGHQHQG